MNVSILCKNKDVLQDKNIDFEDLESHRPRAIQNQTQAEPDGDPTRKTRVESRIDQLLEDLQD